MKNKIIGIIIFIVAISLIGYLFFNEKEKSKESEVEVDFSATGNLIMNNPGLEEGKWYIVYEKEGSPGVTKKLVIGENDIACKGEEGNCSDFFNFKNNIIGERVELKGEERGSEVVVYEVEFLKN
jgi:hypothetical protein